MKIKTRHESCHFCPHYNRHSSVCSCVRLQTASRTLSDDISAPTVTLQSSYWSTFPDCLNEEAQPTGHLSYLNECGRHFSSSGNSCKWRLLFTCQAQYKHNSFCLYFLCLHLYLLMRPYKTKQLSVVLSISPLIAWYARHDASKIFLISFTLPVPQSVFSQQRRLQGGAGALKDYCSRIRMSY